MSEQKLPPIRVKYRDITFRSKTEGKWAVFLDEIGMDWSYELFTTKGYRPDFNLHIKTDTYTADVFFEVKGYPDQMTDEYMSKIESFSRDNRIIVGLGFPRDYRDYANTFGNDCRLFSTYYLRHDSVDAKLLIFTKKGFAYASKDLSTYEDMNRAFDIANSTSFEVVPEEEYQKMINKLMRTKQQIVTPVANEQKRLGKQIKERMRKFNPIITQPEMVDIAMPGRYSTRRAKAELMKRLWDGDPKENEAQLYVKFIDALDKLESGEIKRTKISPRKPEKTEDKNDQIEIKDEPRSLCDQNETVTLILTGLPVSEFDRFDGLARAGRSSPDDIVCEFIKSLLDSFDKWAKEGSLNG